jgi:tRNA(Ile)-lysidine synthase
VRRSRQSHRPTLLRLAQREIRNNALIDAGTCVLVAVSGGPDSMALLHVMATLRDRLGFGLAAHCINHGLREGATGEAELARALAERLAVPFGLTALEVTPGPNVMARARDARMAALREAAKRAGADRIALGHHADDRAETVLMRLLRGAGPAGLAVMAPRAEDRIRPFIRARRLDVLRHLDRYGIAFAQDPTNRDARYLRTVVREELLPSMERLSPRVVEHLCDLADDLGALGLRSPAPCYNRSQLRALARAAMGNDPSIRVSLPGGRIARFDPETRRIVVEDGEGTPGVRKPRSAEQHATPR